MKTKGMPAFCVLPENRDQENSGRLCLKCRRAGNSGEESLWDHTVNFSAV